MRLRALGERSARLLAVVLGDLGPKIVLEAPRFGHLATKGSPFAIYCLNRHRHRPVGVGRGGMADGHPEECRHGEGKPKLEDAPGAHDHTPWGKPPNGDREDTISLGRPPPVPGWVEDDPQEKVSRRAVGGRRRSPSPLEARLSSEGWMQDSRHTSIWSGSRRSQPANAPAPAHVRIHGPNACLGASGAAMVTPCSAGQQAG
jgi:hypothetical protein